jgi:Ca2+/Na+ antiporter
MAPGEPSSRPALLAGTALLGAIVLATIVAFWHFVVSEYEMRKTRHSMIRFTNRYAEVAKDLLLLLFAMSTLAYAWADTSALLRTHRSLWFSIAGCACLVAWSIALLWIAISDMMFLIHRKGAQPVT